MRNLTKSVLLAICLAFLAINATPPAAATAYTSNYHGYTQAPKAHAPANQSRCWLYSYTHRYDNSGDFVPSAPHCWIVTNEPTKRERDEPRERDKPAPPTEEPTITEEPTKEPTKERNNNGHGNNHDGADCSNPGKGKRHDTDSDPTVDDEKPKKVRSK